MISRLSEDQLKEKAWEVLAKHLGPVEAMRFLSLVRTNPRDYQAWREERFKDLTARGLIDQLKSLDAKSGLSPETDSGFHAR